MCILQIDIEPTGLVCNECNRAGFILSQQPGIYLFKINNKNKRKVMVLIQNDLYLYLSIHNIYSRYFINRFCFVYSRQPCIYLFKVNNKNNKKDVVFFQTVSSMSIRTTLLRCCSSVSIINFEQTLDHILVFLLSTLRR